MKSKTCKDCSVAKPVAEFYVSSGNSCKLCRIAYEKNRRAVSSAVRDYDNRRSKTPERRAHLKANAKSWIENHPERYKAHNAANNAIRDGKLKKQESCQSCGSRKYIHKHHPDYSKPLDVVWLCARCHALEKY